MRTARAVDAATARRLAGGPGANDTRICTRPVKRRLRDSADDLPVPPEYHSVLHIVHMAAEQGGTGHVGGLQKSEGLPSALMKNGPHIEFSSDQNPTANAVQVRRRFAARRIRENFRQGLKRESLIWGDAHSPCPPRWQRMTSETFGRALGRIFPAFRWRCR